MAAPKTRWLDRTVAPRGPYVTLCLSDDEFRQAMKRLKCSSYPADIGDGLMATITLQSPKGLTCVVVVSDMTEFTGPEIAAMLCHEAVHVWRAHCRQLGEVTPGEEQEAYGIQFIAQTLMDEYARRQVAA